MRWISCTWVVLALFTLSGCTQAPDDGQQGNRGPTRVNGDVTADGSGARTVNGSIQVPSGLKTGDVVTVNGSIHIGDNAAVDKASAVNGGIHLGNHATAAALATVNGGISVGDGTHISEAVTSVNGSVTLENGSEIAGRLRNVNGDIHLQDAHIAEGIETVNGSIDIFGTSHVEGGIHVKKANSFWFLRWFRSDSHPPRIVIGPGAVVQGDLRFERKVELYVSDKATIGPVIGATAQRFSGDQPPG